MGPRGTSLDEAAEQELWPRVRTLVDTHDVAGVAVAVTREGVDVSRAFGVRDIGTGEPVTDQTMFHLASVSKPFVATAVATLSSGPEPRLDLDDPVVRWVPEFALADGREEEVTVRRLLSHSSGLPDVSEYGWHDPQLDDEALSRFAAGLSGWRLKSEPGPTYSYSHAGYELVGLVLSRVVGDTFENAVRRQLLGPLGMEHSTFMRAEVPTGLAASPHVGMPLQVPEGCYPYTRRHAPSSTLHSNLVEMARWMRANLEAGDGQPARIDPRILEFMTRPAIEVGTPPWEEHAGLGWALGSYRGHRTLSHSGADPGFGARVVQLPERRIGVVVLANSNTVPASLIAAAALDMALGDPIENEADREVGLLESVLPPVAGPVAEALETSGAGAAASTYHRLLQADPTQVDPDDEGFVDAVWGAIELHRPDLVWPLLDLWTSLRPSSSSAWTMAGWAHHVDGDSARARSLLEQALDLDPGNDEAAQILHSM